MLSSHNKRSRF